MKRAGLGVLIFVLLGMGLAQKNAGVSSIETADQPLSSTYHELQWSRILPDLGASSPEIAFLHVDPQTKATQLMIRNRVPIHVTMHWHSANETHTVLRGTVVFEHEGSRNTLGPGGFNYIPKRMHHQAWLPANGLVFITVDAAWDVNWVEGPPTARDLNARPGGEPRAGKPRP